MKRFTKITAIILAVIMLVCPIVSCSTAGTPVLEYGKSKITANMYSYWLSRYKALYLYTFGVNDTDEFWSTEVASGITAETYLGAIALQGIMTTLISMEMFDNLGLKLDSATLNAIDEYIAGLVTEYGGGSKSSFNQYASSYGVNDKILREIYIAEEKASQLQDYFYGSNGTEKITDLQRDEYYKSNYAKIQHLYINNKYEYVLNDDGTYKYDADGNTQRQAISGDALTEKNNTISEIDAKLEEGASFEDLWTEYSEDQYYENGYYLSSSTNFISQVTTAALQMEVGAVQKVESEVGIHYIKKYDLDEKAYSDERNADFFGSFDSYVIQSQFSLKLQGKLADVITTDELGNYSIRTATPNGSF